MAESLTYYDSPLTGEELDAAFRKIPQIDASVEAAANSATQAQSWTKGGTGTREGEDTDNAEYWCGKAQEVANGSLGWYADTAALKATHPTGETGQWAILGATDTVWVWSTDAGAWVETGGARLYKATFLVDGWSGSGPYTQTVAVTPVDGGPPVTSDTVLCSDFGVDDTLGTAVYRVQMKAAALLCKSQNKTFGTGTLTLAMAEKPAADAEFYFMAKKGGM